MRNDRPAWTEMEDAVLQVMYEESCLISDISALLNRTEQACRMRANRLGLHRPKVAS